MADFYLYPPAPEAEPVSFGLQTTTVMRAAEVVALPHFLLTATPEFSSI